jgi:hypothetical protein
MLCAVSDSAFSFESIGLRGIFSSVLACSIFQPRSVKKNQWDEFDRDDSIVDVLTSSRSQDAYEVYLYPKAKDKTVKEVIDNYKQYLNRLVQLPKGFLL